MPRAKLSSDTTIHYYIPYTAIYSHTTSTYPIREPQNCEERSDGRADPSVNKKTMSLYNYRNATAEAKVRVSESLCLIDQESAGLIAESEVIIKNHVLAMLREGLRMGLSSTRRDLRECVQQARY